MLLIIVNSQWTLFQKFVIKLGNSEANKSLIEPDEKTPTLIAAWIFQKCEKPNSKDSSTMQCENASFSHALKMRAAISYHYAQDEQRGSAKWHQDLQGKWIGNPALSHIVSRYMISLQRRKVSLSKMILDIFEKTCIRKYRIQF